MATDLKRARVAARIGQAESAQLPTTSSNTHKMLQKTEEKRSLLDRRCSHYETATSKLRKAKSLSNRLANDRSVLLMHWDEVNAAGEGLEKKTEKVRTAQRLQNAELDQIVQQLTAIDNEEGILLERINEEKRTHQKKHEQKTRTRSDQDETEMWTVKDAKESERLRTSFEQSEEIKKELENQLTALKGDLLNHQQQLSNAQKGAARKTPDLRVTEGKIPELKTNQRAGRQRSSTRSPKATMGFEDAKKELTTLEHEWTAIKRNIKELEQFQTAPMSQPSSTHSASFRETHSRKTGDSRGLGQESANDQNLSAHNKHVEVHNLRRDFGDKLPISILTKAGATPRQSTSAPSVTAPSRDQRHRFAAPVSDLGYQEFWNEDDDEDPSDREERGVNMNSRQRGKSDLELSGLERTRLIRLRDELRSKQYENELTKIRLENVKEARKDVENKSTSGDLQRLAGERSLLEHEMSTLTNEIRDLQAVYRKLDEDRTIFKSRDSNESTLHELDRLDTEIDVWQRLVVSLAAEVNNLRTMDTQAASANRRLRDQLAVLKPYDDEYMKFETLAQYNRQLDARIQQKDSPTEISKLYRNNRPTTNQ